MSNDRALAMREHTAYHKTMLAKTPVLYTLERMDSLSLAFGDGVWQVLDFS
jgi:hypothetical protein